MRIRFGIITILFSLVLLTACAGDAQSSSQETAENEVGIAADITEVEEVQAGEQSESIEAEAKSNSGGEPQPEGDPERGMEIFPNGSLNESY